MKRDRRAAGWSSPLDDSAEPPLATGELGALLDHLFVKTGLDFRRYSPRSVQRRLRHVMLQDGFESVAQLRAHLAAPEAATRLAERMCVKVTSMFRDPRFWIAFRARVVPLLRPLPLVRVWHAGCATGEEVYSLAILLREEGLYHRCRLYATDVDESALARARAGIYPLDNIQEYTHNYVRAGGGAAFCEYYTASSQGLVLKPELRRNVVLARHDLATDTAFNEFHVIVCRNALIYFGASLQERAHELFWRSLAPGGVLALGQREIVPPPLAQGRYEPLDLAYKLYRRVGVR